MVVILGLVACGFVNIDDGDSTNDPGDSEDSGGTSASWCDDAHSEAAPSGPDCFSGTLSCGQTVEATTGGGNAQFVSADYTANFCFTNLAGESYAGAERVYLVSLEAEAYAVATLEADCAPMGLAVMRWTDGTTCPVDQSVPECEGKEGEGSLSATFGGYPSGNQWVVVVDTAGADPAAFRLNLDCE